MYIRVTKFLNNEINYLYESNIKVSYEHLNLILNKIFMLAALCTKKKINSKPILNMSKGDFVENTFS